MFKKSNSNHSKAEDNRCSTFPTSPGRECVMVIEGPAFLQLETWIDNNLDELLLRNVEFETPSSRNRNSHR
ncbi:MAG TPA: hypothetical protein PKD64_12225 [Pirellulaceae bacterium]|nr:hypothetical protein [Pirellulaceae bacterium]HMO92953.1 hypothetical protein [Pirellulaceae bacterium]HMP68482.1 hypothetical protein [Pirellulaceae bacterium]